MNRWISIVKSIISDIKKIRTNFFVYTIIFLISVVLSNTFSKLTINHQSEFNFLMFGILLTISISIIQNINAIYFQRAYSSSKKIKNIEYTSIPKVILHTFRILLVQVLLFLPLCIIYMLIIIVPIIITKNVSFNLIAWMLVPFIIIIVFWISRLLFIRMILVYKREKIKMKEVIFESKEIIKNNLLLIIPILVIQYMPSIILAEYAILTRNTSNYSIFYLIFSAITNYLFSLIYLRLIIENYENIDKLQLTIAST